MAREEAGAAVIRADELFGLDAFKDLDSAQRGVVCDLLEEKVIPDGGTLFLEGQPGDAAYIVLGGTVRVLREGEGGEQCPVADVKAGWIVGEMALLDGGPRSASAVASGQCRLAVLPLAAFEDLVSDHPAVASLVLRRLARMLSLRLRRANALST